MLGEGDLPPVSPCIGFLDSGVGGLSIYDVVRRDLPGARYIYCFDNLNFPYGTKTDEQVIAAVRQAVGKLISDYHLDMLVIACNTASTMALAAIRAEFKIPIIGVVPAVKPAAALTKSGAFGVLATAAAVQHSYIDDLVQKFAPHHRVIRVGSKMLVELAEAKLRGESICLKAVAAEIAPFFASADDSSLPRVDVVVLGCTHFPLLVEELRQVSPWPVQWIDSSAAIAARVRYLLGELRREWIGVGVATTAVNSVAVFTKRDVQVTSLKKNLAAYGFIRIDFLF